MGIRDTIPTCHVSIRHFINSLIRYISKQVSLKFDDTASHAATLSTVIHVS